MSSDNIGPVVALPDMKDHVGHYVDAAAVRVDLCISSWCNSNLGLSFGRDIKGLALAGRNDIHDVATTVVAMGNPVFKVGRRTGRTEGKVNAVHAPFLFGGVLYHDVIEIEGVSMQAGTSNCGGALRFADKGDSGSALVNAQRDLVGLVHSIDRTRPNITYASHIQPVLKALAVVVPITEQNPVHGNPAAVGMGGDALATVAGPDRRAELRGAFLATETGRELAAEIERHRREVVRLVNHVRRVTIAWHRSQGPAFLNRAIANARDPGEPIPHEIAGISRERLLETMADTLSAHGSPELAAAIARRREEAIARAAAIEDLQQLVDDLAAERVP
jgi:hypothetical protein